MKKAIHGFRMGRRRILLIASPAMLALLVAYVVHVVPRFKHPGARGREVSVLVAARDLAIETAISENDVVMAKLPAADVLLAGFHDAQAVLGRTTILALSKGEPILPYELGGYGDPIPSPAMRAVRLELKKADVPARVQLGAQLDILVTGSSPGRRVAPTTTALKNVPVLAITGGRGEAASGSGVVLTLLVSPENARQLARARLRGRIQIFKSVYFN